MSIESDKEIRLRKYIKENDDCLTGGRFQTEYKGQLIPCEIYRIPIELLTYNLENGRFAADKLAEEARLKRRLNPEDKEDVEKIKKLLLEKDPKETNQLKDDLARIGQVNPGIITVAGNVINANRRMAILSELQEKTGDEKYGYLDVGILPKGADSRDIWIAESKIQFGQEFKVKYGPINVSLKIRDAIQNRNMNEADVANALSMKVEEIQNYLKRLNLIERYLSYIGRPKEYNYLEKEGIYEHFINTQNNLDSTKDDFLGVEDEIKFRDLHFESINAGFPHLFIRKLKNVKNDEGTKEKSFSILSKLKDNKVGLESFKDEIRETMELYEIKIKGEPKRLLQRAHGLLYEFNKHVQELNVPEKNLFSYIEEIVKQIKEKL